jgi:S-adenosylmethionine synthetase
MEFVFEAEVSPRLSQRAVEVVERKGLGHPDTICDALAEEVSVALCQYYLDKFGTVLHHNVDKVLLVGGQSRPAFGGGSVETPMEIYIAGRAANDVRGVPVPVQELAIETCRAWLRAHIRHLDVDRHVRLHCKVRPGSADLTELFLREQHRPVPGEWLANDTSCGSGFAPNTPLEALVLSTEQLLRAPAALQAHPERGEDLKVMAVRLGTRTRFTVSTAFVDRHVRHLDDYRDKRASLLSDVQTLAHAEHVEVNTADNLDTGSIYLTVTGTSAEAGDDGEAGRGNRVGGLITPYRPMTLESAAGKNAVTHVGKIYNIAARRIAGAVVSDIEGVRSAECFLVSRIGRPVRDPALVHVRVWLAYGRSLENVEGRVSRIAHDQLAAVAEIRQDVLARRALIL